MEGTAQEKTVVNTGGEEDKPRTEPELMQDMNAAVKSGDYKAVAKVAQALVKFQKEKEAAELTAKQKELEVITDEVLSALNAALKPLIDAKKLDSADGVWFVQDFGEKLVSCRLTKSAKRASTGGTGGGGGKKFTVSTKDLLEQFGDQDYKDGMTYSEAQEHSTDKNWRYAIREALLKKGGHIS